MRHIRLLIEYEGTNYAGWQVQENLPTIQGMVMDAIKKLTGEAVTLFGASRTDAGVHALGQVASFKTGSLVPIIAFRNGLNSYLPEDIVIKDASEVPDSFDPRRDSKEKTYLYRVINRPYPSAIMRRFAWSVFQPLDISAMKEACPHIIGEKDFSSFRAADSDAPHSIREVLSIDIHEKDEGLIEFEVRGTAFLRHMIRIMAGTLVAVGKGKVNPAAVHGIIEAKDRAAAGMTAPAQGLTLVRIVY